MPCVQDYLGHKNIQNTVDYLRPGRFDNILGEFTRDCQAGEPRGVAFPMNQAPAVSALSAAAARMRKYRERRRQGETIVSLKLGLSDISDLAALDWMPAVVRTDKNALCGALIELIEQAIALRITPTTTTSEGTRFAPLCATAGPTITECDEALSPRVRTSAEPGEVFGATAAAAEIVEDHPPGLQPRAERNRPFEIDPVEFWEPRLVLYLRRKMWMPGWGPRPDQDGCQAPAWLLEATGMWPSGLA